MNLEDYAIVIGLTGYPGFTNPPANLKGPINDVDSIVKWLLCADGGGVPKKNIKRIVTAKSPVPPVAPRTNDLDEKAFLWIDKLAKKNADAGLGRKVGRRLYVYMSGHGFSPQHRQGCLLTVDAGPGRVTANIAATSWLQWWQDAGYFQEYVLLLDCCMNRMNSAVPTAVPLQAINSDTPPAATFIAFAAKRPLKAVEAAIAEDGGKVHGLFTWAFLDGLKGAAVNRFGTVTGHSMANWLRASLSERLTEVAPDDVEVSFEPEIVMSDPALIFARGIQPLLFGLTLRFEADAVGKIARLWGGTPPSASELRIAQQEIVQPLAAGLYVIDVPGTKYRQGFEVTKSTVVEIKEEGPTVTPQPVGTIFNCVIDGGDPANGISITAASDYEIVETGTGSLNARLSYGIYRSRIRSGSQFSGKVFMLDRHLGGAAVVLQPSSPLPQALSAMPFPAAPHSHEYQSSVVGQIRERCTKGKSGLALVVRSWTPQDEPSIREPWRGIELVDEVGEAVIDFSAASEKHATDQDPFAYYVLEIPPATYFLRYPDKELRRNELALTVAPNWYLEVYLLRSRTKGEEAPPRLSLVLRRPDDAIQHWTETHNQRLEKALLALVDERPILNSDLKHLLLQKFVSPMEGIVGAHLLLIQHASDRATDLSPLNKVVRNMRGLLGDNHPDVEALSLRCPDITLRRTAAFAAPPLLERSWQLIVAASHDKPDLVPVDLWTRVQALSPNPPYLAWSSDTATKENYHTALFEILQREMAEMPNDQLENIEAVAGDLVDYGWLNDTTTASQSAGGDHELASAQRKRATTTGAGIPATEAKERTRRFAQVYQLPTSAISALKKKSGD